jgi:surfeit locus 1 family protein
VSARVAPRGLVLPALLAAIGFAILLALGFWQLERRAWKDELIGRVETRTRASAQPIPAEPEWPKVNAARDEYRVVTASGTLRHEREVLVHALLSEPRGKFSGPGYWVLTPLVLDSGAIVIVNRGFVPADRRNPATRREGQPTGPVTVTGLLRMPEAPTWFTPDNDPARGEWFVREPQTIARAFGLTRVAPFTIDADASPNLGGLPAGGETRLNFPNNHLGYAFTWFGLAAALAGVFGVFAWQRLRGRR